MPSERRHRSSSRTPPPGCPVYRSQLDSILENFRIQLTKDLTGSATTAVTATVNASTGTFLREYDKTTQARFVQQDEQIARVDEDVVGLKKRKLDVEKRMEALGQRLALTSSQVATLRTAGPPSALLMPARFMDFCGCLELLAV